MSLELAVGKECEGAGCSWGVGAAVSAWSGLGLKGDPST